MNTADTMAARTTQRATARATGSPPATRRTGRTAPARDGRQRGGARAGRGDNPYSPPRGGGRDRSPSRRQRPKGTSGLAWSSVICAGLFLILFLGIMATAMSQVRSVSEGGEVSGGAVAGLGAMGLLIWPTALAGLITGIIALFQSGRPKGVAIAGVIGNGLPLLWLGIGILRGAAALSSM